MGRTKKIFLEDPEQYLSRKLRLNLQNVKKEYMDKDQDFFVLIVADKTGLGMGKSVLWQLMAAYMDKLLHPKGKLSFHTGRIFFNETDFRMESPTMKPLDCFGWDEPDAFFSLEGGTKKQRRLKMKLIHIRQQRHFMCLCADSIFTVGPWMRPGVESRINVLIRIVRKGVAYAYTTKTGSLQKIQIDTRKRKVIYPAADLIFFWKKIPKDTEWWIDYYKRKQHFLKHVDNPKAMKLYAKQEKERHNTLTCSDIAEIQSVHKNTVKRWIRNGWFGKRGIYIDAGGTQRLKMSTYNKGIKRVMKEKQKAAKKRGRRTRK